jgi:two-component system, cell cycle sensor histidine kinase and response regulator CckA
MDEGSFRVLLIEDDEDDYTIIKALLSEAPALTFQLDWVTGYEAGIEAMRGREYDICLLDYMLGARTGLEFIQELSNESIETPIIILTGHGTYEVDIQAIRSGAADYLVKGHINADLLERSVRHAIERKRAENQLARYYHQLEQLVRERTIELERANRSLHQEIAEREQIEAALSESKTHLDEIINAIADPIFVKDRQHRYVLVNDAYCRFVSFKRDELLGKSPHEFFPKNEADAFLSKDEEVLATGGEIQSEEKVTDAKGVSHIIVTKKTLYKNDKGEKFVVGISSDITEQKNLEEQLFHAVKMEAIGRLAGGIAHDFNNLMTSVIGYSDLSLQRIGKDDPLRKGIEQIKKAGQSAASLTNQLLIFSRKQVVQPKVLDINRVIADIEKMLRRVIGEDIMVVSELSPDLRRVLGDPGQIEQVIMNLAVNARDAMPQGGRLTIETKNGYLDEAYAQQHLDVQPGHYVMLAVSDTGIGMTEETRSRIFEPFYTTKEKGKGTGLGLATVYGIVKQSGGHIWVYSEPGRGTTFKVYLPRVDEDSGCPSLEPVHCEVVRGKSETILLVEDDDCVRDLASTCLRISGYTILVARRGDEALRIFKENEQAIQMLVTDVVMPGVSGRDLARIMQSLSPGLKVLYTSGYTDDAIVHHGVLDAGVNFLQKPFTLDALARKVRQVLDEPAENPD